MIQEDQKTFEVLLCLWPLYDEFLGCSFLFIYALCSNESSCLIIILKKLGLFWKKLVTYTIVFEEGFDDRLNLWRKNRCLGKYLLKNLKFPD